MRLPLQPVRQRPSGREAGRHGCTAPARRCRADHRATASRPAVRCSAAPASSASSASRARRLSAGHVDRLALDQAEPADRARPRAARARLRSTITLCPRGTPSSPVRGSANASKTTHARNRSDPDRLDQRRRSATPATAARRPCGPAPARSSSNSRSSSSSAQTRGRPSSNTPKSSSRLPVHHLLAGDRVQQQCVVAARRGRGRSTRSPPWWSGWPVNPSGPKVITVSGRTSSRDDLIREPPPRPRRHPRSHRPGSPANSARSCPSTSRRPRARHGRELVVRVPDSTPASPRVAVTQATRWPASVSEADTPPAK